MDKVQKKEKKKKKTDHTSQKGIVLKMSKKKKKKIRIYHFCYLEEDIFLTFTVPSNTYQQDIFQKNVFLVLCECLFHGWSAQQN